MESRYDDRRSKIKIRNDVMNIKDDFPIFKSKNINELVYFDNASTTQKPKVVIDSIVDYYSNYNANIHRGSYTIAEKSTESYEWVRNKIAQFINADQDEIVFTSGTTQSINFIAYSYGNNVLAMQCHVEMTLPLISNWINSWKDDLTIESASQQSYTQISEDLERKVSELNLVASSLYTRWVSTLTI